MSGPSRATPSPERDQQLLSIGKQCTHPSCNLVDFLPFKCQHCEQSFCQDHFKVEAHKCPNYDETKHNRVAPSCPLCNTPVAIPPGQDPNVRMEQHFTQDCSVMLGKTVKKSTPICARGKCGKILYAPIRCDKCQKQFCPAHRFPGDHTCTQTTAGKPSATRPDASTAASRLLNVNTKALNDKASAAGAAIKKTISSNIPNVSNNTPTAVKASVSTSTSSSSSHSNPFSKTESSVSLSNDNPSPPTNNTTVPLRINKSKPNNLLRNSYAPPPIFATA